MCVVTLFFINRGINRGINQSGYLSGNLPGNQSGNQSIEESINRVISWGINQGINRGINQSGNQSIEQPRIQMCVATLFFVCTSCKATHVFGATHISILVDAVPYNASLNTEEICTHLIWYHKTASILFCAQRPSAASSRTLYKEDTGIPGMWCITRTAIITTATPLPPPLPPP